MKSSVKSGVEWCDRAPFAAGLVENPSLVPEKKSNGVLSVWCTLMVGTRSQYNALLGTGRFGGWPLRVTRGHPGSLETSWESLHRKF